MATAKNLGSILGEDVQATPTTEKAGETSSSTKPTEKRRSSAKQASGSKKTASSSKSKPASGTKTKQQQSEAEQSKPARSEPHVRTPATDEAERVGLYLDPDDYKELQMARAEDKADANARLRAMIAVWRSNSRVRAQVDRLARTAPRGPYSGKRSK